MSVIFTMPGKRGDALHSWPIVYHYCQKNETRCRLWLDEKTLAPLKPLFEAQPCVEAVELKPGITSWHMGGQPWDFGLTTQDHIDQQIIHLGFRTFPSRQITMEVLHQSPVGFKSIDSAAPTLFVREPGTGQTEDRLILHGTFAAPGQGVPGFWKFVYDIQDWIDHQFEEVAFIGTPEETARAKELYPRWGVFQDDGDFLKLARYVVDAKLCIGSGSAGVVLASLLKVPTVRVHDPIGEFPKVIWSNLGGRHLNETERDLRKVWPDFRDELFTDNSPTEDDLKYAKEGELSYREAAGLHLK